MTRKNFLLVVTGFVSGVVQKSRANTGLEVTISMPTPSPSLDLALLANAIAEVETGNDDTRIGLHGERSRYQIKPSVWSQHGYTRPFTHCHGALASLCADQHLRWLDRSLARTTPIERDMREYALAWCWHGGLSSWTTPIRSQRRITSLNNYATRVTNLYQSADFRQRVGA